MSSMALSSSVLVLPLKLESQDLSLGQQFKCSVNLPYFRSSSPSFCNVTAKPQFLCKISSFGVSSKLVCLGSGRDRNLKCKSFGGNRFFFNKISRSVVVRSGVEDPGKEKKVESEPKDPSESQNGGTIGYYKTGPQIMELRLDEIRRPLSRTRANDPEKVKYLMESIAEIGLQEPIDVLEVKGKYYGFSGCHRFEAHQRLGLSTIKCRVRRGTESTLRMHMM